MSLRHNRNTSPRYEYSHTSYSRKQAPRVHWYCCLLDDRAGGLLAIPNDVFAGRGCSCSTYTSYIATLQLSEVLPASTER